MASSRSTISDSDGRCRVAASPVSQASAACVCVYVCVCMCILRFVVVLYVCVRLQLFPLFLLVPLFPEGRGGGKRFEREKEGEGEEREPGGGAEEHNAQPAHRQAKPGGGLAAAHIDPVATAARRPVGTRWWWRTTRTRLWHTEAGSRARSCSSPAHNGAGGSHARSSTMMNHPGSHTRGPPHHQW